MKTQNSFSLGAIPKQSNAPTLPAPLDPTAFHTRQEIREHQEAQQYFYDYQRDIETQARIDADNARAKVLAESDRELTDDEYDSLKRKQWHAEKDKQAAILAKEKSDELEKIAYLLSSPPVAEIFVRNEFAALQLVIHWAARGYMLQDEGYLNFGNSFCHLQMTAPAVKKAAK
jgi:hypothetical protein